MRFRDKIAKEALKGKKLVGKRGAEEEHIGADQRGNHSSAKISPLSLSSKAITPKPKLPKVESAKQSRRSFFSFGTLGDFAEEVAEDVPETESQEKDDVLAEQVEDVEAQDEPAPEEKIDLTERKGFFRRLLDKVRPGSKKEETPVDANITEKPLPTEEPLVVEAEAEEGPEPEVDPNEDPEYDRRNLLRKGVHFFAKPAVNKVQSKIDSVNQALDKVTKRVPLIRPPGAITEQKFLQACTRCDKCIQACPKDAILKAPKAMGFFVMGTPYIDPKKNPCVMCDDLYCISACPDAALLPVASKLDVKMGYAILDEKKCQAYGHTFCQQCVIDCPIPGAITQVDEKPIFHKNTCTGCGVCVSSCGTVNIPVAIKIKPQMVIEQQLLKKRLEREQAEREKEHRLADAERARLEREEEEQQTESTS